VTQEERQRWSRGLLPVMVLGTMVACGGEAPQRPAEPPRQVEDLMERARALHREVPLVDGHNDFPWALRRRVPSRDLARLDISEPQAAIMTDIPRLRTGGVGAVFWAAYVPASTPGPEAVRMTHEQIDVVHRMAERYPDVFELARSAADVERIFAAGRIASLIGIEGGHSIDGSLERLRAMYERGVRYMTLTHSRNLPWADAATDVRKTGGLTPFGEEVVAEMNRLGMLVDLSHVSPDTMAHALQVTRAPVIFSHSSARALTDVPRNVPDDILRRIPENGGVVMVTFVPGFVSPAVAAYERREDEERRRLTRAHPKNPAAVERGLREFRDANARPRATLADVADHIDHVRAVAGIDHVGIGSDFDGIEHVPVGLEDVSTFPALTAELLRRGYADEDVKKVLGSNVLRVMREAERVAEGR
jgi:membrane dipeptidase